MSIEFWHYDVGGESRDVVTWDKSFCPSQTKEAASSFLDSPGAQSPKDSLSNPEEKIFRHFLVLSEGKLKAN